MGEKEKEKQRERESALPPAIRVYFHSTLAKNDPFQNLPWKSAHGWRPALGPAVGLFRAPCACTGLGAEARHRAGDVAMTPTAPAGVSAALFMSTVRLGPPHKELWHLCTQNLDIGPKILNLTENLQPRWFSKGTHIFFKVCVDVSFYYRFHLMR